MAYPSDQTELPHPLRNGDAATIRGLLLRRLDGLRAAHEGDRLSERASSLLSAMAPVLAWMRDHQAIRLTDGVVSYAMQLRAIAALATHRLFLVRSQETGGISELPVREMPEALVYPLNAYLADLPGYDTGRTFEAQLGDEARRQHGMVLFMALSSVAGARDTA